jgi:hypothetical protein
LGHAAAGAACGAGEGDHGTTQRDGRVAAAALALVALGAAAVLAAAAVAALAATVAFVLAVCDDADVGAACSVRTVAGDAGCSRPASV